MKSHLLLTLLAASCCATAQTTPPRIFTTNVNAWFNYFGDHPLTPKSKWGLHAEVQWRRHDVVSRWQQLLIRPGVNYEVNPNLVLTAGYGYIATSRYGAYPVAVPFPEHRIFQQVLLKQSFGKWALSHRYRLEQRFLGELRVLPGGARERVRWRHENRFRYAFRIARPIRGPWGIALSDEIKLNFGKNVASNVFDQNRAYAAVTRTFGKNTRVEVGYLNQLAQQRNGRIFENNHTLQIALYSTAPLLRR